MSADRNRQALFTRICARQSWCDIVSMLGFEAVHVVCKKNKKCYRKLCWSCVDVDITNNNFLVISYRCHSYDYNYITL